MNFFIGIDRMEVHVSDGGLDVVMLNFLHECELDGTINGQIDQDIVRSAVLEDFREALAVELHVHVFAAFAVNDSRNDSFLPQTIDGSCADGGSWGNGDINDVGHSSVSED
jgi:hypothetical protein